MPAVAIEGSSIRRRPSKLDSILPAASRLFRADGYGATTMEAVAKEADVSKATLYVYFSGKRELFAAVIEAEGDLNSRALIAGEGGQEDMRQKLLRFGRAILNLLLAPETVGAYRMVTAEARQFPEIAHVFYERGPARLLGRLEEFFAGAMQSGKLRSAHPRRAAEQFVGLIRGDLQLRAMLAIDDNSNLQEDEVIRSGVDTFYRAYQPGGDAKSDSDV
jgi:TetR/AcrR family transcriptional regulator, mexJK operon transcriptional repressor